MILHIHVSETFPLCIIVYVKTLKWLLCQWPQTVSCSVKRSLAFVFVKLLKSFRYNSACY